MNNSGFEQKRFLQKFKEYISLFLYIILILAFSIAVMDILVFSATLFAVNNKELYSKIFVLGIVFILIIYFSVKVSLSIIKYRKDKLKLKEILIIFLKNRISGILSFLLVILLVLSVIFIAKFLLEQNYYLIYKTLK